MVVQNGVGVYSDSLLKGDKLSEATFVQALNDKYVDQLEFDNRFVLPKDKSITTDITFVGFGEVSSIQKQLRQLISIDLSRLNIGSAGDLTSLSGALNRVQILNLSYNLLPWDEIVLILSCLPNLRELILNGNRLGPGLNNPPKILYKKLSSLTIGRVNLKWHQFVEILSQIWIGIDQLDIWDNSLGSDCLELQLGNSIHSNLVRNLKALRLSKNNLPSLDWVDGIGPVDSLVELDISNCHMKSLEIKFLEKLVALKHLNISSNDIGDWISVSNLSVLKKLESLICHDNPFYLTDKLAKSFTIAKLANIKSLNREEVTKSQRRDAEILYLRKSYPEYLEFRAGKNGQFNQLHPRYQELITLYGLPEDLNKKQIVDKYINVTLSLGDRKICKKLPSDMRISNLKMLTKRLFKLPLNRSIRIVCRESEASDELTSYVLDKEEQTLHFFSVMNDSILEINLND